GRRSGGTDPGNQSAVRVGPGAGVKTDRWRTGLLLAVLAAVIGGCSSAPPRGGQAGYDAPAPRSSVRARINLSGFPPAYRESHSAGCGSDSRDEARYKSDTNYMMGWDDGHSICVSRK